MTIIITRQRFTALLAVSPRNFRVHWTQRPGDTRTPLNPHIRTRNYA